MFKPGDIVVLENQNYFHFEKNKPKYLIGTIVEVLEMTKLNDEEYLWFYWEKAFRNVSYADIRNFRLATERERFLYYTYGQKVLIEIGG